MFVYIYIYMYICVYTIYIYIYTFSLSRLVAGVHEAVVRVLVLVGVAAAEEGVERRHELRVVHPGLALDAQILREALHEPRALVVLRAASGAAASGFLSSCFAFFLLVIIHHYLYVSPSCLYLLFF